MTYQRGFAEIAYGVYVANAETELNSSSFAVHSGCSSSSLFRLRKAEAALRLGGHLGSLDHERGNLWVFFDQESLLSPDVVSAADGKLRNAGCRPAVPVGSSIKASDLLQKSNTPLRRLFLTAIRALVGRALTSRLSWIPLNHQTYLRPSVQLGFGTKHERGVPGSLAPSIATVNIQLYSDGLASVDLYSHTTTEIIRLSEYLAHEKPEQSRQNLYVFLAPIGRTGNLVELDGCRCSSTQSSAKNASPSKSISHHRNLSPEEDLWKRSVLAWLGSIGIEISGGGDTCWIEVEVSVQNSANQDPSQEDTATASNASAGPTRVLWPSDLTFVRASDHIARHERPVEHVDLKCDDPIAFVEEWAKSTSTRADAIGKRKATRIAKQLQRDQPRVTESSRDDDSGDVLNAFPRMYQDMSSISGIYPTPPDGALSQATPGPPLETAFDTPRERDNMAQSQNNHIEVDDTDHMDLFENNENTTGGINSSLYDDDLFDDSAGGNFASGGIADEPNWDFFDEQAHNSNPEDPVSALVQENGDSPQAKEEQESTTLQGVKKATEQMKDRSLDQGPVAGEGELNETESKPELSDDADRCLLVKSGNDVPMQDVADFFDNVSPTVFDHHSSLTQQRKSVDEEHQSNAQAKSNGVEPLTQGGQDEKYGAEGRFWFRFEQTTNHGRDKFRHSGPRDNSAHTFSSTPGALPVQYSLNKPASPESADETVSSGSYDYGGPERSDLSDQCSNQDGAHDLPMEHDEGPGPTAIGQLLENHVNLLEWLLDDHDDLSSLEYFCDSAKDPLPSLVNWEDNLMKVAQVLVDQISQSSLRSSFKYDDIQDDLESCLIRTENGGSLLFREVAAMYDIQSISLKTPQIQVKRDEKTLRALPSLLAFWDTFALQPAGGSKDVMGYCIYPDQVVSAERCENFLDRIGDAYSSCSLGSHVRGNAQGVSNRGLVPWAFDIAQPLESLAHTCELLGATLPSISLPGVNYVIYIMNPYSQENLAAPASICAAFLRLFSSYLDSRSATATQPIDVVLQLVPISFISSTESLVILPQSTYVRLAIEVYNRCPPRKIPENFAECGSAVTIARPYPRKLNFMLSPNAWLPATANEKALHVAYCQSPDKRWVTSAWTDIEGSMALTMSYCLRRGNSNVSRSLTEIIKEIWDTSLDLVRASEEHRKYCWRLFVVKNQFVEPEEVETWTDMVANQASTSALNVQPMSMTIATMAVRPVLKIKVSSSLPSSVTQPTTGATHSTPHPGAANYGTPATTPTPAHSVLSPEQLMLSAPTPTATGASTGNAPTPPAPDHSFEVDPDTVLTDPADESEYLILPTSRISNNMSSTYDYCPAILSSYLLHRAFVGAPLPGQLAAVGVDVNLIQNIKTGTPNTAPAKSDREFLVELLEQYRSLTTLAKSRGMAASPEYPLLPWHLNTAMQGVKALGSAL